jgi:hypothetical protein
VEGRNFKKGRKIKKVVVLGSEQAAFLRGSSGRKRYCFSRSESAGGGSAYLCE